jgi:hypothetical protein
MGFNDIIDRIKQSEDYQEIMKLNIKEFFNGNILTKNFLKKQYLLLILIVVLAALYTDNRYASERQITRINELNKKIKDARYESLTISANLMETSKQSNIASMLEARGINLMQGTKPPVVIE